MSLKIQKKKKAESVIPPERIDGRIYLMRGKKVMLDEDLATLYGVSTKVLNQAVRRHKDRFPKDFMFQLSLENMRNLRSQIVTSSHGGRRYKSLAFTEQGIAMLSTVLNSPQAIRVNIQIMRAFVRLREMMVENDQLRKKVEKMERQYDEQFMMIFSSLRELFREDIMSTQDEIGFKPPKH